MEWHDYGSEYPKFVNWASVLLETETFKPREEEIRGVEDITRGDKQCILTEQPSNGNVGSDYLMS